MTAELAVDLEHQLDLILLSAAWSTVATGQ